MADDKRKKSLCVVVFVLLGWTVLVLACSSGPVFSVVPTDMPTPTHIPRRIAPPYAEICTRLTDKNSTDAQSKTYIEELKGTVADHWTGQIMDVTRRSSLIYEVTVNMDERFPPERPDVLLETSEQNALGPRKGDRVTFSGTVGQVTDLFHPCYVKLIDGVIHEYGAETPGAVGAFN